MKFMVDYKFKFKKERFENSWTLRPKIKVNISYKGISKDVICILDTGSDLNYIPLDMADYFCLSLSEETLTAQGAETEFSYKTSKIYVRLDHPHRTYRKLIEVMVPAKAANHKDIIFGANFLKDFIVNLDYLKGTITLTVNQKGLQAKATKIR